MNLNYTPHSHLILYLFFFYFLKQIINFCYFNKDDLEFKDESIDSFLFSFSYFTILDGDSYFTIWVPANQNIKHYYTLKLLNNALLSLSQFFWNC